MQVVSKQKRKRSARGANAVGTRGSKSGTLKNHTSFSYLNEFLPPSMWHTTKSPAKSIRRNTSGRSMNGTSMNGTSMNGTSMNGRSMNGRSMNGRSMNGRSMNGRSTSGRKNPDTLSSYSSLKRMLPDSKWNTIKTQDQSVRKSLRDSIQTTTPNINNILPSHSIPSTKPPRTRMPDIINPYPMGIVHPPPHYIPSQKVRNNRKRMADFVQTPSVRKQEMDDYVKTPSVRKQKARNNLKRMADFVQTPSVRKQEMDDYVKTPSVRKQKARNNLKRMADYVQTPSV